MTARKLRFGMVGGGQGAFIGAVHRIAAQMDGEAELVAAALSSNPQRARESAAALFIDPARAYGTFAEMARAESAHDSSSRLDFVVIVTPNHLHFAPAKAFLESGFNVVLDKPLAFDLREALQLRDIVASSRKVLALTHTYAGFAMVKQARELVRTGRLGALRSIVVEYSQGWLAESVETRGNKQASWRTDPKRSGAAGSVGDIGTHAAHLAQYVSGLRIEELCADLTTIVEGRALDDHASMLLRFTGGARGILHCSQVSLGEENNLRLRLYGSQASLEWSLQRADELLVRYADRPAETWGRGNAYAPVSARFSRVPPGHPEGYLEAFANIYREAFRAIRAEVAAQPIPTDTDFPGVEEGVEGMRFIAAAVDSSRAGGKWTRIARE
jgi:predicted dehydrogenase